MPVKVLPVLVGMSKPLNKGVRKHVIRILGTSLQMLTDVQNSFYFELCLHFNDHFPGEPGLAGVY